MSSTGRFQIAVTEYYAVWDAKKTLVMRTYVMVRKGMGLEPTEWKVVYLTDKMIRKLIVFQNAGI
jgi:hypothetical protein